MRECILATKMEKELCDNAPSAPTNSYMF